MNHPIDSCSLRSTPLECKSLLKRSVNPALRGFCGFLDDEVEKRFDMNHLIDTDDKKVADPELRRREQATQLKFLETLIDKLLSTMRFRKAKTPNGSSAILWDDQLLSQDTDINIHNSLQENELEEK